MLCNDDQDVDCHALFLQYIASCLLHRFEGNVFGSLPLALGTDIIETKHHSTILEVQIGWVQTWRM